MHIDERFSVSENILKYLEQSYVYDPHYDDTGKYKIQLGIALCHKLIAEDTMNYIANAKDEIPTIFGIPIEVDFNNPYEFKIWKDVTERGW